MTSPKTVTPDQPQAVPDMVRGGIYTASKTRHAPLWKNYRSRGWPINSTWIDEAGVGETGDFADLWRRCVAEASSASVLVVHCEEGDVLKGAWVEVGAALASGVPVFAVGIEHFSVAKDKRITHFVTIEDAMDSAAHLAARPVLPVETPAEGLREAVEWVWYGQDENGSEHVSLGRWQKHPCQFRYKLAEIQPTEHDHPTSEPS